MDEALELLKRTVFAVEANGFERHALWREVGHNSPYLPKLANLTWEDQGGWLVTIPSKHDRPVCITLSFVKLNGQFVAFWYACSQLVDHVVIEEWWKENFHAKDEDGRPAMSDAFNFGQCITLVEKLTTRKS